MKKLMLLLLLLVSLNFIGCSHEPKNIRHFNSPVEIENFVQSRGVKTHDQFENEHGQWVLVYKEVN